MVKHSCTRNNAQADSLEEIFEGALDRSRHSLVLFQKAYKGALNALSSAEKMLCRAICLYGPEYLVGYPDTAYYLPVILSLSGEKVTRLGELVPILKRRRSCIKKELTFANALLCGESTAYAAEIIEALGYINSDKLCAVRSGTGFLGDRFLRRFGIPLLDWTAPGLAVLMGRAGSTGTLARIVSDLQAKGFIIFLAGEVADQAGEAGLNLGIDFKTFPLERFTGVIHAVNFALRIGLAFGGIPPGAKNEQRDYQQRQVRAFVLQFGERDDLETAAHFAAIFFGFPVLLDNKLPEDEQIPNWYLSHPHYETLVRAALEARGIKLKGLNISVPFTVAPAFEGEAIRKKDMYLELGGKRNFCFELVKMVGESEIEDGKVKVIGPDVDRIEEGAAIDGGIYIKVYGRRMQEDFEGVLERRIQNFINYGEGLGHTGQRNTCCCRVSKDCVAKGFKFNHYGELLIAGIKDVFSAVVDRVQVTIYTDPKIVKDKLKEAKQAYAGRDARMAGLTDEAVDVFYSCAVCQSLAPNHICVITPERPGLCGAVSWLEARISSELDTAGPNRLIKKEGMIDEKKGIWESINDFVFNNTNRTVKVCSLYSLIDHPMTSCRFFECLTGIVPEANGVMIINREYRGLTPCGMDFSTLADFVGVGRQTPGFMGHGRGYILSKKFIKGDGGLARVIWMPRELKDRLGDELRKSALIQGLGAGFVDKIADESIGTTGEEILPFLEEKKHPALEMASLI